MADPVPAQQPVQPAQQPIQPVAPVSVQPELPAQQPVPQAPVQVVSEQPQVVQRPVETEDKTRYGQEMDKLKEHNRRLFETNQLLQTEIQRRMQFNQQFAPIQQQGQVVPQQQLNEEDFVTIDPLTGDRFIDEPKLRQALTQARQEATTARTVVQNYINSSEQREVQRQEKETFAVYPELNPNSQNFNANMSNQASALIFHSLVAPQNYGGRPLTFLEAANIVTGGQQKGVPQLQPVQQKAQQQGSQAQEAKEQASVTLQSQPQQVLPSNNPELETLRMRTRLGDEEALAKRILNTDHVMKHE